MKRNMKRISIITLMIISLAGAFALAGCDGGGVPQVSGGTYEFESGAMDEQTLPADSFEGEKYVFEEDGTCEYTMAAFDDEEEMSFEGTYSQDGAAVNVILDMDGEETTMEFKVAGDTIIYSIEMPATDEEGNETDGDPSVMTLTYKRAE